MNDNRGLTLLEILLALVVLSMVMTMISLSLSGTFDVLESVRSRGEIDYQAQVALLRIREDISSAIYDPLVPFTGQSIEQGAHRADRLRFVSQGHVVFNREVELDGPAIITYEAAADEEDPDDLTLYRRDVLLRPGAESESETQNPEHDETQRFMLAKHLRSVSFRYSGAEGESDTWDTEQSTNEENSVHLPAVVNCTLEFWLDRGEDSFVSYNSKILLPVGWSTLSSGQGNP
ncbi:MAG: prepilin-type N-terminal cleavage/methylation domain-containing protein [Desulfobulbaceae bacterium]|nr:prepilin-type N-terminal cleavage/methylation domain-containing protein [Desulfobulbaceae bacterium]